MNLISTQKSSYCEGAVTERYHATAKEAIEAIRKAANATRLYAHVDISSGIDGDNEHFYRNHVSVPLTRASAMELVKDISRNWKDDSTDRIILSIYTSPQAGRVHSYRAIYIG